MLKLKEDKEQAQKEAEQQKIREEEEQARKDATVKEQARLQQEVAHEDHLKAMQKRWDDNRQAVNNAVKAAEMDAALTSQSTHKVPESEDLLQPGSPGDVNDTEMDGEEEGLGNDTTPHARGTDNKIGVYAPEQQRAFEEWQRRDDFEVKQRAARFAANSKALGLGRDATTWYRGREVPDTARKTPNIFEGADAPMAASSPAPPGAPEQLMAMFQGFFQQQQQQLQEMQFQQRTDSQRKSATKQKRKRDEDSDVNSTDSEEEVKVVEHTPNTARRILWQRGHGALLPSTIRGIIAEATVRTLAEARAPLQDLGFAIIEDMTEVYAPKNRCTKEQRDFIHKCKYALPTSTLLCHTTMFM
jgi:hypothetical protein